jgi:hypothetical protein
MQIQTNAMGMGANLVTLNNQAEHDWVYNTFSAAEPLLDWAQ